MNRSRLQGAAWFAIAFTAFQFIFSGVARESWREPLLPLIVVVAGFAIGYVLWPPAIFFVALYRERGYSLRPSLLRILWTVTYAVVGFLLGLLSARLGGREVLSTDLLRWGLLAAAIVYFSYLPPRDTVSPTR